MRYTQLTEDNVRHMLDAAGAATVSDLFRTVPERLRLGRPLDLPRGVSEMEILGDAEALARKNHDCGELTCFLGGGAYDHFIPTIVDALAGQSEFLTAYTPYQAEASQGILQLFYEFQTMICLLTGAEVANASMYEFSTAATEAVMMATGITRRSRVLVAENAHPDTLRVLDTYAYVRGVTVERIPLAGGVIDESRLRHMLNDETAAVLIQSPNFFGCAERMDRIIPMIQEHGALAIVSTDPLAGGVLKTPGEFGADLIVGEGQALGVPMQYGGPYLGLLAGREKFLRKMPGRVVGVASDADGRRGFCLVLQTREQHIKRERATSNICTNQGLLAVRASVYLAAMGRNGIEEVAGQCFDKSHYAAEQIAAVDGFELAFDAPFFKEFVVRSSRDVRGVLAACRERGMLAGVPLGDFDPRFEDCFLVAVTEKRTRGEIDALVAALRGA